MDPREAATKLKNRSAVKKKPKTREEVVKNHLELSIMEDMPYDQQKYPHGPLPSNPSQAPSETRLDTLEALLPNLPDLGEEEKQEENLPSYEEEVVDEGWAPGEYQTSSIQSSQWDRRHLSHTPFSCAPWRLLVRMGVCALSRS